MYLYPVLHNVDCTVPVSCFSSRLLQESGGSGARIPSGPPITSSYQVRLSQCSWDLSTHREHVRIRFQEPSSTEKRSPQQEENLVKMKDPLMGTVSINPEGSDSYSPNRTVFNMEASVPWKEYFLNHPAILREFLGQNPVEQVIKTNRSINLHKGQWRFYLGWCGEAWCQWWLYHLWQGHNWPAIQVIYQDSFLIVNQQGKLKDWN